MMPARSGEPLAPAPAAAPGFHPRPVALGRAGSLVRESCALLLAAPGRLIGLYFVAFLVVQIFSGVAYLAVPLRWALASVAYTGFYLALDRVRCGQQPGLRDMGRPWVLPFDRIALLVVAGVLPVLLAWLIWWIDLGSAEMARLLSAPLAADDDAPGALPSAAHPALAQMVELAAVGGLLNIPLLLLQPLCILYDWSATRTLSANLLASLANWRWGVAMAVLVAPVSVALDASHPKTGLELLAIILVDIALGMFLSAFTLVLLRHSLDAAPAVLRAP